MATKVVPVKTAAGPRRRTNGRSLDLLGHFNRHSPDSRSDAEMNALGEMLVRGVSIDEIAQRLRRDHGEIREKVAKVGRACR